MRKAHPSRTLQTHSLPWCGVAALGATIAAAVGCGATSGAPGGQTGGAGGGGRIAIGNTGGAQASAGGAGGSSGVAGAGSATGGAGADAAAGAPGDGGNIGVGGSCEPGTSFTMATHEIVNVTWPAGPATLGGTGQVHLWGKMTLTAAGNRLTGSSQPCGTVLPATDLNPAIGGGKILIDIPFAAWDAPGGPQVPIDATQTGWSVGDTISYSYSALIGLAQAPAGGQWPASYAGLTMTVDVEGDGYPGVTGVPRNGSGYLMPPTSALGAVSTGPRADRLYLVDRDEAATTLKRTACDQAAGTTTFTHFDNHVVGCHVAGGTECSPTDTKFIDDNRTIYTVTSATTTTRIVADDVTCAEIRAALPM